MENKILEYTKIFFSKLSINIEKIKIEKESNNLYNIKIKSSDGELIIGNNGGTLESLQRILGMSIINIFDKEIRIKLTINDYYKKYQDKLFLRIDNSIKSLLNNGGEYDFGILSPYDRKKTHSYIARNYNNIISKSRGKGENRKLFLHIENKKYSYTETKSNIIKKQPIINKLTIDINGDGI